jgi:hypothetical protein
VNSYFFKYRCNVWRIRFGGLHQVAVPISDGNNCVRHVFWTPLLATTNPFIRILTHLKCMYKNIYKLLFCGQNYFRRSLKCLINAQKI